jgi:hypothetical protein
MDSVWGVVRRRKKLEILGIRNYGKISFYWGDD